VPFLGYILDPLEQDHYIHKLVSKFSISEKVIREQIRKVDSKQYTVDSAQTKNPIAVPGLLLQKEVLGGIIYFDDFLSSVKFKVEASDFEDAEIRNLAMAWLQSGDRDGVKQNPLAKESIFMVESQLEELGDATLIKRNLEKSFSLLKTSALKKKQVNLQNQIKAAETSGNKAKVLELNTAFAEILKERAEFEKNI